MNSIVVNSVVRHKLNCVVRCLVHAVDHAAWRVSIDSSPVDLRIVHESAGSFFEEPINPLFIVVPGTKMYVRENQKKNKIKSVKI